MAEITAALVKALRELTGQGMMDCKKALQDAGGDVQAAKDLLRKKGLVTAEKKSGRPTKEGLIGIHASPDGTAAAMAEIQCETDFTARNEEFGAMVKAAAEMVANAPQDGPVEATAEISGAVQAVLTKTRENMSYARGVKITAPKIATYLHHTGKVGVLVGVDGEVPDQTLGDLCMHIAFAEPIGITPEDIPAEGIEKEKAFALEQAAESGKPPQIAEKIVAGKMKKFLAANALLEQPFVRDDKKKVKEILGGATVTAFARFAVGGPGTILIR